MLDFNLGLLKFVQVSESEFRLQGAFLMMYRTVNLEIPTSEIKFKRTISPETQVNVTETTFHYLTHLYVPSQVT